MLILLIPSAVMGFAHGVEGTQQDGSDIIVRCNANVSTYHPVVFSVSDESTKVYPHVILGGVGCTAVVNSPAGIWAEQDIILDKGFELSANTPFSARVISVPNGSESELYINGNQ